MGMFSNCRITLLGHLCCGSSDLTSSRRAGGTGRLIAVKDAPRGRELYPWIGGYKDSELLQKVILEAVPCSILQANGFLVIYNTTKNIFSRRSIFLYSPCPNLEGIKDALSYKFGRLMIGQNCCAVCTNKVARA